MQKKRIASEEENSTTITIRVSTRKPRTEISGVTEDGLVKIHLTAPPVEGKANQELVKFLSSILDIPMSNIKITAGFSSRNKRVLINSPDYAEILNKLKDKIS